MVVCISQFRVLVLSLTLGLSACQTVDDGPSSDAWNEAAPVRISAVQDRPHRSNSAPLLANARGGPSTVIEGSGRFVGEPATGAIGKSPEDVSDGVTLNLVNVPAPQAAKTVLGDILQVRYTVDPGIEGKITIQTPKPVSRSAVIDLFQAALRSNNAAIINNNGMYQIVAADKALIGASIKTDDSPMDSAMVRTLSDTP